MKKLLFLPFSLLLIGLSAFADIRMPAVLSDHMVLQENSTVKIWGWCDIRENIKLTTTWDTTKYTTTGGGDGKWSIQIKTPAGGGPYTLIITGRNRVIIDDVLIGEVWVCSGQSNMEMSANWGMRQYDSVVVTATNTSIRFFHIPRTTALYPQDDLKAKWVVCNPDDMKRFSIVGYFFGQFYSVRYSQPPDLHEVRQWISHSYRRQSQSKHCYIHEELSIRFLHTQKSTDAQDVQLLAYRNLKEHNHS